MSARSLRTARRLRSSSRKPSRSRNRLLRTEPLEPRTLLSGQAIVGVISVYPAPPAVTPVRLATPMTVNTAPTLAQAISVNNNAPITGRTASLSVLGNDDGGEAKLVYTWSVTAAPAGGTATFNMNGTNAAKNATATFTKAGTYQVSVKIADTSGLYATGVKSFIVSSTLTSIGLSTSTGQAVSPSAALALAGTSQALVAQGLDQFGYAVSAQPGLTWSITTVPTGTPQPGLTVKGAAATVTFAKAGIYGLRVQAAGTASVVANVALNVTQTLTSIAVSPNVCNVFQGYNQQFTAQGYDQFGKAMATPPTFTWSATAGTITAAGVFTAPGSGASSTVSAKNGSVTGTAAVTLLANSGTFQTPALNALVQSLDADGSINRTDMIQILRSTGADGVVNATEFSDLKKLLSLQTTYKIPDYVEVLAGDVVNGNVANATYQGQQLGNLAAGSSAAQLNDLIGKWFLGTDHPTLCDTSLVYRTVSGSLFPHTPSHTDEYQGELGDCYFISALGTLADSNPAAVENMFINNGDGTYTVRFYTSSYGIGGYYSDGGISAGFTNNVGTADYITVDSMLPTGSTGILAYADYGASYNNPANSLWIPLAEKAYAQWNQTGKEGRDGTNAFASIQGGWMATVDAQVLNHNGTDYILTKTPEQIAISALTAKKAVTIGTANFSGNPSGLYANHAYAIIGYNAATDKFTLYNPWGSDQPDQLTWSQLQADCTQLCVCDTSGSVPIISGAVAAASNKTSSGRILDIAGESPFQSAVDAPSPPGAAPASGGSSAAAHASRKVFAALDCDAAVEWHRTDIASPVDRAGRASLVDATLLDDDLWLRDEALAALV